MDRVLIANGIQAHLDAKGLFRKVLLRHDLCESTINKVFQGVFSERTLRKIEAILNCRFSSESKAGEPDAASDHLGGYAYHTVKYLEGEYLCARPLFSNPININAYIIEIKWDRSQKALTFQEKSRADYKYRHNGCVYIAWGTPFMNLVTVESGTVRSLLVSLPDEAGMSS